MILSVIIIVTGWFINSHLNRKHEIFKKKLDYRLMMYDSYVLAAIILEKLLNINQTEDTGILTKEFLTNLEKAQVQIILYGSKSEIEAINEIVLLASKNKHQEMKNKSADFMLLIRNNLRSELGIKSSKLDNKI